MTKWTAKKFAALRNSWHHRLYEECKLVKRIFNAIIKTNILLFFIITLLFYVMGILINVYVPFPKFYFFQVIFICIYLISFISVRYFERQMSELNRLMSGDLALHKINDKVYRMRRSVLNIIVPPVLGAFFGIQAVLLVNIDINILSAYYLILTYILCVLISFIGYLQYIFLAFYIYSLSKNKRAIVYYNKDYPANTKWVVMLTKLYGRYRNTFFLLGTLYIAGVIYYIACGSFKVWEKISAYPMLYISLALFLGGTFIAIAVLFPICSILEYRNIKMIVENLKNQTVCQLNKELTRGIKNRVADNPEIRIQQSQLIISILNTPEYPVKDVLGFLFSGALSFANFAASIVTILQFSNHR